MLKMILAAIAIMSVSSFAGSKSSDINQNNIRVTKKMIEGKVFYSHDAVDDYYILSSFKNIDPVDHYGKVVYIMMRSPESISGYTESVSYGIEDGKIVIYGNDGSSTRYTLITTASGKWVLMEEEDVDGHDKYSNYKKKGKRTWYLKKPKGYPALEKCKPFEMECKVDAFKFPA
jgi:hypothetical protein